MSAELGQALSCALGTAASPAGGGTGTSLCPRHSPSFHTRVREPEDTRACGNVAAAAAVR